ncbi:hypothetical protein HALLA_07490 [Halostagnicola larsenii XH-48]|uniref:Uncharacterized protein n=1 Tax=Halostagnicola larsenii XH-48 TaxID=797299 RepID=W0JQ10_9EURY|nr:hypothetical protein [Halostagnicola larsenii]AHG00786.1 hypothetical protein HALLA_07490 [Halostagnicola larsenii XH-48]
MNRRQFLGTVGCVAIPAVAGCLTDPGTNGGLLEILLTTEPENATVVNATDERIRNVEPVQDGLREAADATSSAAEVEVTEREYETVAQVLADLPWYDRSDHDSKHISGIYFRYDKQVYVVVLTPFCADSWLKDTESQRGEYGWGGCYDRAEWGYE